MIRKLIFSILCICAGLTIIWRSLIFARKPKYISLRSLSDYANRKY